MSYVELHARSAFSFFRGASQPEVLADRAGELDLPGVALCDRNGFYGSVRFHQRSLENGFRAAVGTELTMTDGTVLPLLIRNRRGYRSVSRLITRAQLRAPKGECPVKWSELEEVVDDVAVLTGDFEGPLELAWQRGGAREMELALEQLKRHVPERQIWMEVQRHAIRGEETLVQAKRDLAEAYGLPLLATNGPCYAVPENRRVQDVFTCLRLHTTLDAAGRELAVNSERHLKPGAVMEQLFHDLPEAITNTSRLF